MDRKLTDLERLYVNRGNTCLWCKHYSVRQHPRDKRGFVHPQCGECTSERVREIESLKDEIQLLILHPDKDTCSFFQQAYDENGEET